MEHKRTDRDLVIRRLLEVDQGDINSHFRRLDSDSRRARFCGSINDAGIMRYVHSIFQRDSILIGAFIDGQLRGVAELRGVFHFWSLNAEAAFSVDPDWQSIGIGDALFERVLTMAQNRCVRSIRLIYLKENTRMKHLAIKHGARLCFDHDMMEATLHLKLPMPASVASEITGEAKWFTRMLGW